MSSVFHLVYVSKAAEDLSYSDLRAILDSSRKNNMKDNITGVLVLRDGYFLQVLEGNQAPVQTLVEKIKVDDRNHSLRVIIETNSEQRFFGDWSMAFLDGDIESNSTQELVSFFEACIDSGIDKQALIMPLVRRFRASAPSFQ